MKWSSLSQQAVYSILNSFLNVDGKLVAQSRKELTNTINLAGEFKTEADRAKAIGEVSALLAKINTGENVTTDAIMAVVSKFSPADQRNLTVLFGDKLKGMFDFGSYAKSRTDLMTVRIKAEGVVRDKNGEVKSSQDLFGSFSVKNPSVLTRDGIKVDPSARFELSLAGGVRVWGSATGNASVSLKELYLGEVKLSDEDKEKNKVGFILSGI